MRFCSECGAVIATRIPPGDNRPRFCCDQCGVIHYENPKLVVGTIPVWEDQVLLCRRAIEPRLGFWTLPAGFMENGETVEEGAIRETEEEAGAHIELGALFSMIDVVHVHQVHVFYRAALSDLVFDPGPESLEVRMFRESEIPWSDLAFRTTIRTLEFYFADRQRNLFEVHTAAISFPAKHPSGNVTPTLPVL